MGIKLLTRYRKEWKEASKVSGRLRFQEAARAPQAEETKEGLGRSHVEAPGRCAPEERFLRPALLPVSSSG